MTKKDAPDDKDETAITSPTLGRSILSNATLLGLFALACTIFIATTFLSTKDDIAERKREARLKALLEIVPRTRHNNDMLSDNIPFHHDSLGHRQQQLLFLAKKNDQPITLIYPATTRDGYSGDIDYIVGVNIDDKTIAGVRVLNHRETPGLGDGIEMRKSNWVLGFNGKSLNNPTIEKWTVKKDGGSFDGFTGATITPRALTQSIANVLKFHNHNVVEILKLFESSKEPTQSNLEE